MGKMVYATIIEALFARFPFLEQRYLEEGSYIFGLAHLCYSFIFVPYIREVIENKDILVIECVCDFLEDMAICEDELVSELLVVSVLETILSERALIKELKKYLKTETMGWLLYLEKAYGWET
jgi:hypothetical protein